MISPAEAVGGSSRFASAAGTAGAPDGLPFDWPNRDSSLKVDADGVRWHAQRLGSGPGLLLIHGTAASTHTWRDLMPLLAEHYEVLAMDLPGHGYSSLRPDGAMTLDALADSVSSLVEAVDFTPRYIVGHSAGAAIALRMSLDWASSGRTIGPDAVVGLNAALLPFGGMLKSVFSPLAQLFATTRLMPRMVARRARDQKAVRRVLVGTGSTIDDRGVELYQRLLEREGHVAAVLQMMASWELEPLLEALPRCAARLFLVAGCRDKAVSPGEADSIAKLLPGTRVARLDNRGHLAHEEAPGEVAALIRAACRPVAGAATDG